jgi:hypothetical protein
VFLREVLTRFERHGLFEARRQPLLRTWAALHTLLGPDKAVDPAACGVRGRRLQDTMQTVDRWGAMGLPRPLLLHIVGQSGDVAGCNAHVQI